MNTLVRYIAGNVAYNSTSPSPGPGPDPGPDPQGSYPIIFDGNYPAIADVEIVDCTGVDWLDGPYPDSPQFTWRDANNGYGISITFEALNDSTGDTLYDIPLGYKDGYYQWWPIDFYVTGSISLIAANGEAVWTAQDGALVENFWTNAYKSPDGDTCTVDLPGLYIYGTGTVEMQGVPDITITKV